MRDVVLRKSFSRVGMSQDVGTSTRSSLVSRKKPPPSSCPMINNNALGSDKVQRGGSRSRVFNFDCECGYAVFRQNHLER
jgi:hypothetical protein